MLQEHFGFTDRPFPSTPDPSLFYPSTNHELALTTLQRGIDDDEGILLLSGIPGAGKTLLGYVLLQRLSDRVHSAFLTNSHLVNRTALLQAILYDLGLAYEGEGEQVLRLRLTDHLLQTCAAEKRTLLFVDEAHHLSADLLEELRLLANLEAGRGKAFQVILIAQPILAHTLRQPSLEALQQRIAARAVAEPLDAEEAYDYLLHHLRLAGGKAEKAFEETALEVLAHGARGLPRLLNQAAHQALLLAADGELPAVDAEAALEALSMLGLSATELTDEGEKLADSDLTHPNIRDFRRPA